MTPSRWRSSSCTPQKQPPARIAVSALSLIAFSVSEVARWSECEAFPPRPSGSHPAPATILGDCDRLCQLPGKVAVPRHRDRFELEPAGEQPQLVRELRGDRA